MAEAVPSTLAALATWLGIVAVIVAAAFTFSAQTAYPGSLVAIPVLGAALIIAGGWSHPGLGVEALLGLGPFHGFGKLSYSLYLWHWPILIIAAEYAGKSSLPVPQSLGWDLVALVLRWSPTPRREPHPPRQVPAPHALGQCRPGGRLVVVALGA